MRKEFWKYFFDTFRAAKWLMLKYLIVGVYLIAVGVIANRLQLDDLTYYNAMVTLCYFAEIVGYAFNEGFGIYVNQNIRNPQKSKGYAKLGFYCAAVFSGVILIFMLAVPRFVVGTVLGIVGEVNYTFYYFMAVSLFLNGISCYIAELLKKVEMFRFQMVCSIIQCGLVLGGFLLLVFTGFFNLNLIGIVYVVANLLCAIFGYIILLQNKKYRVNLLKIEKVNIDKEERVVVMTRTLTEIVWEVGFMFISLFVLKSDIIVYNQYCYYENVLDVFSGLVFAFFNITAIKICRSIGEGEKSKAYNDGVNSMKATFVMWGIYALLAAISFIPLRMGMNEELRDTAIDAFVLYLVLALFRFLDWNMGSYILGQSEIYTKHCLVLECAATIFWIVMYIVAGVVEFGVFAIYSIILFETLCKLIVQTIWFKKKKWVNKL